MFSLLVLSTSKVPSPWIGGAVSKTVFHLFSWLYFLFLPTPFAFNPNFSCFMKEFSLLLCLLGLYCFDVNASTTETNGLSL